MEKIKVIIWGFGAMGSGMTEMLLKKKGIRISGICTGRPETVRESVDTLIADSKVEIEHIIIENYLSYCRINKINM